MIDLLGLCQALTTNDKMCICFLESAKRCQGCHGLSGDGELLQQLETLGPAVETENRLTWWICKLW